MKNEIKERTIKEADIMLNENKTIREIASLLKVSKSTVHKDISQRLKFIDKTKYNLIKNVLKKHVDVRHINGGESTRKKFKNMKKYSFKMK